jgi:hypothetical protein
MVWNYGAVPVNLTKNLNLNKKSNKKIQRSQSKILRMIVDAPWYVSMHNYTPI